MSTTTNSETHQNGEDRVPEVEAMIDAKLQELAQIPVGPHGGRRLEIGGVSPVECERLIRVGMRDIAERLTPDILDIMPVVAIEQLIVMSVTNNHDTAGLIKSLLNSFLAAYITPETSTRAFHHLEGLESLRAEVASARKGIRLH
jgi:hypothetical protein|tara:strand:- start:10186 stop:10620 length:435 start_codon:yes stop_codon:yes gene_type:complete